MALDLILNPVTSPVTAGDEVILAGTVTGFDGDEFTLDIDLNNDGVNEFTGLVFTDGGANDKDGTKNGTVQFEYTVPNAYPLAGNYTGKVCAKDTLIEGDNLVFVIDSSGSTQGTAGGWTSPDDVDGDGTPGTIHDLQLKGFIEMVEQVVADGRGSTSKISLAQFGTNSRVVDLDTGSTNTWLYADTDADNDGELDVVEIAKTLRNNGSQVGSATNFEAGLQAAITAVTNAGQEGNGTVLFNSDGNNNTGGSFADEVTALTSAPLSQNLIAVGVGNGATLPQLQQIDPDAQVITSGDDYIDFLTGSTQNLIDCETFKITVKDPIIMGVGNVKPESNPSPINLRSRGVTPMAIYGSDELDVSKIIRNTVLVNDDGSFDDGASGSKFKVEDVNKDGFRDLLFKVNTQDLAQYFSPGDTEVFFTGDLVGGMQFLAMHDNAFDPLKIMA